jgi:hypothetical protein
LSISYDITCNIGLFFLIFGFGVIVLAALFMRLFRLRKAFSTSLAVSKVRSEDCKNKPILQVMSEEILKAIKNKKTAFYNWKTNGRIKDIHDPFLLEKKITTYELRKNNPYHNSHLWSVLLVVQSVISILLVSGLLYCVFDFQHKVRQ